MVVAHGSALPVVTRARDLGRCRWREGRVRALSIAGSLPMLYCGSRRDSRLVPRACPTLSQADVVCCRHGRCSHCHGGGHPRGRRARGERGIDNVCRRNAGAGRRAAAHFASGGGVGSAHPPGAHSHTRGHVRRQPQPHSLPHATLAHPAPHGHLGVHPDASASY